MVTKKYEKRKLYQGYLYKTWIILPKNGLTGPQGWPKHPRTYFRGYNLFWPNWGECVSHTLKMTFNVFLNIFHHKITHANE